MPGKGVMVRWTCLRRQNHFVDALYCAAAAGWYCGVQLPDEKPPPVKKPIPLDSFVQTRPDSRPWIDLDRWDEDRGCTLARTLLFRPSAGESRRLSS